MKTLAFIILVLVVGCGGAASVGDISNQQDQQQTNDGDIQTAQEACAYCVESYEKEGSSLSECVTKMGFDVSDC